MTRSALEVDSRLRGALDDAISGTVLDEPETQPRVENSLTRKRAYRNARAGSAMATVSLVRDDEVLRWVYEPPPATLARRRGRRASATTDPAQVVHGFQFLEVPPNKVRQSLKDLDDKLTPHQGLNQWKDGKLVAVDVAAVKGPVLLLVHGTFSSSDMFFEELGATTAGKAWLAKTQAHYRTILTFDHPTLAVPPWVNALDLKTALARTREPIDVVCHSRGGLVTSWWLYLDTARKARVVFFGSPLEGTSLAAPAKLKAALDLLANIARGVGAVANTAATVVPMLAVAGGLMKVVGGLLSVGSRTPLLDAGVALVPGLAAQSRDSTNFELVRLLANDWSRRVELYAVQSNFEPPENTEPWWKFWSAFRTVPSKLADWGADRVFDGPNDLVVDVASMTRLGNYAIPSEWQLDLSGVRPVHHCSYFRQPEALAFVTNAFGL